MTLLVDERIANYLISKDSIFNILIEKYGYLKIESSNDLFPDIIYNIVGQMLSNKAANKIYSRLVEKCNGIITPISIDSLNPDEIRNCGIAYSKVNYIKKFANEIINNKYDFNSLNKMSDDELIIYLKKIDGVGQWTAEMISLFSLCRKNIFSYDDIALKNGIIKAHGYKTLSKKRFEGLHKKYSPYCSLAALYFYKVNDDPYFKL